MSLLKKYGCDALGILSILYFLPACGLLLATVPGLSTNLFDSQILAKLFQCALFLGCAIGIQRRSYILGYLFSSGVAGALIIFNLNRLAADSTIHQLGALATILAFGVALVVLNTTLRPLFHNQAAYSQVRLRVGLNDEDRFKEAANS